MAESTHRISRREFVQAATTAAAVLSVGRSASAYGVANNKLRVGVVGLGRGMGHVQALVKLQGDKNVDLAYVCDVDQERIASAMKALESGDKKLEKPPQPVADFRKMLDDQSLNAVFIATPNFWHAPAAILACSAGKHVYVEKPGSHNPREGELLVEAARKGKRIVQMGNQRRSWPAVQEAMKRLHDGVIGRVTYARCYYNNARPSIGKGMPADPPSHLDFSMWHGPAPLRPYKSNLIPYNWHWHWHYGNGELGNNGIHALDVARWGLNVDYPTKVTYLGGRYQHDDDWETPDTGSAQFHFGDRGCSWEGSSCHPRKNDKLPFVEFYGDKGSLSILDVNYKVYNLGGEEIDQGKGAGGDLDHFANFLDCVRSGQPPNSEIEIGQKSTLLCHLGNIAYRTGQVLHFDPATKKTIDNKPAEALWSREYRPGWEPKV